jgi:hypothetical protein
MLCCSLDLLDEMTATPSSGEKYTSKRHTFHFQRGVEFQNGHRTGTDHPKHFIEFGRVIFKPGEPNGPGVNIVIHVPVGCGEVHELLSRPGNDQ